MSSPQNAAFANAGKKAVHVKWAGKTIALGTFPAAEADEKCARAKALTRAWRSTMRPKPSRDWVMLELERLGVRVVSGRLGRKAGEDGEDGVIEGGKKPGGPAIPGMDERSNSIGWNGSDADLNLMMGHGARRNSSLGLSMINDGRRGSLGSLGAIGIDPGDPTMPPHRPLVGGGAAAAYEAARHDHFTQKSAEQQRRASSLGLGSLGGGLGNMGMSVNPNQHYEMLKLHHMNLLNEIQETTLMMNLYQQQQLQQQQQQLQQQASSDQMGGGVGDHNMAMLLQQQGGGGGNIDMFALNQRQSLGLGGNQLNGNFGSHQHMQMLQHQMAQGGQAGGPGSSGGGQDVPGEDQPGLEGRIAQLKQDIARSEGGHPGSMSGNKRQAGDDGREPKRPKQEDDDDDDGDDDDDDEEQHKG